MKHANSRKLRTLYVGQHVSGYDSSGTIMYSGIVGMIASDIALIDLFSPFKNEENIIVHRKTKKPDSIFGAYKESIFAKNNTGYLIEEINWKHIIEN